MQVDKNGLTNVSAAELASLELKEQETGPIWLAFRSPSGKKYKAGHWVRYPKGSAIRLIGEDKDRGDFEKVIATMMGPMMVAPKDRILDRGDDICQDLPFVDLPNVRYFNQWIAERVETFYLRTFKEVAIERVFVNIPLNLTLRDGIFYVTPTLTPQGLEVGTVLSVRTAFEEMELGENGYIVVNSDDKRWKNLLVFLLGERFSPQRVQPEFAVV